MASDQAAERALLHAALQEAVKYHAQTANSHNARGAAKPETVTATAEQFAAFLRRVADKAGVDADDLIRSDSNDPPQSNIGAGRAGRGQSGS